MAICRWSLFLSISRLVGRSVGWLGGDGGSFLCLFVCCLSLALLLFSFAVFYCRLLSFWHCHFAFYSKLDLQFVSLHRHSFVLFNKLLGVLQVDVLAQAATFHIAWILKFRYHCIASPAPKPVPRIECQAAEWTATIKIKIASKHTYSVPLARFIHSSVNGA